MTKLTDQVQKSLDNARRNGYSFKDMNDEQVAIDLNRFDSNLENTPHKKLVEAVHFVRMEQRAISALARTWDQIGWDALQVAVDCGEADDINKVTMTRAEVIDMVTSCGFVGGYPETNGGDKEAVEWLEKQPKKVQDKILRKAFPHGRYGT